MESAKASAAATPFPLPDWQTAELRIVESLALRRAGQESDPSAAAAANSAALQTYPLAAMRSYLKSRTRSGYAQREGL
jgi:hypothetical protein